MNTVTRGHLAGLEMARECVGNCNSETTAWDKCDELDELIAEAMKAQPSGVVDLKQLESVLDDLCGSEGDLPKPGVPIYTISLTEVAEAFRRLNSSPVRKYAEVLVPFFAMMENELHANAGKGDRPGWLKMGRKTALLEIYYHLGKLQKAAKDNDLTGIVEYAADVANMSMMLVDVCGLLTGPLTAVSPSDPAPDKLAEGKVAVTGEALRTVLNALVNAPHLIRELQVTREPVELFADNPINVLIAEYEAAHAAMVNSKTQQGSESE